MTPAMPPPASGQLLVPLYVHPAADPAAWAALAGAGPRIRGVVLNAADGPGQRPDPAFAAAAERLRAAGVPLLGYVDTGYGRRAPRAVVADIRRHRRWYGVDGVFLDQVPAHAAPLPHYRRLVLLAKALGARTAVLNPGTHPDPGYARIADLLVTFEGTWEAYRHAGVPPWTADHPPSRFCHLVYAVPPGAADQVARTAQTRGAAVHCAAPGEGTNPWREVPWPARAPLPAAGPRPGADGFPSGAGASEARPPGSRPGARNFLPGTARAVPGGRASRPGQHGPLPGADGSGIQPGGSPPAAERALPGVYGLRSGTAGAPGAGGSGYAPGRPSGRAR